MRVVRFSKKNNTFITKRVSRYYAAIARVEQTKIIYHNFGGTIDRLELF